eukprot:TRINITY_DN109267_c0_g1_i1.p2 TRINITY_DN109267_c0_g1~~TRINITY_DN109267_c0_g1_i1.p2  ORF type:complete len:236 (+),score=36.46 TRINITY_DN109267_c0_g1_i1:36-710(+)
MAAATFPTWLQHPAPVERRGAGFVSHHDCRPAAHPDRPCCPQQVFYSYGEWFQAHRPERGREATVVSTEKSSNYWPYGKNVTSMIGSVNPNDIVKVDGNVSRSVIAHRPVEITLRPQPRPEELMQAPHSFSGELVTQEHVSSPSARSAGGRGTSLPSSPTLRRAGSATALFGSAYELEVRERKERERAQRHALEAAQRAEFEAWQAAMAMQQQAAMAMHQQPPS